MQEHSIAPLPLSWGGITQTYLGEQYRRISKRRGKKRAKVTVGHSILVIYYHMTGRISRREGFYAPPASPTMTVNPQVYRVPHLLHV